MNWETDRFTGLTATCNGLRYNVVGSVIGLGARRVVFDARVIGDGWGAAEKLGSFPTAAAAVQACEDHAQAVTE